MITAYLTGEVVEIDDGSCVLQVDPIDVPRLILLLQTAYGQHWERCNPSVGVSA